MMEPVTPKLTHPAFGGGGKTTQRPWHKQPRKRWKKTKRTANLRLVLAQVGIYSEKDTAAEHDRKTHLQQDVENWENEETATLREIGKRQREKKEEKAGGKAR